MKRSFVASGRCVVTLTVSVAVPPIRGEAYELAVELRAAERREVRVVDAFVYEDLRAA